MIRFRLGTRGSRLALTQAAMVRDALAAAHGWPVEAIDTVVIRTTGDRVQDRALAEIGGKALWTRELDAALLAGEVDATVHSMKDVETIRPAAITIAACLPRADVRDRLLGATSIDALPPSARVGTASPRRQAQLLHRRPDLRCELFRGNVDTRLAKLAAGQVDATLLAAAGLERLGLDHGVAIPVETMLPAPAQGAIGVEARAGDEAALGALAAIGDAVTLRCVLAERALLAGLSADCHSPVAALATIEDGDLRLRAELLSGDGAERVAGEMAGDGAGARLAAALLDRAPPAIAALFGR